MFLTLHEGHEAGVDLLVLEQQPVVALLRLDEDKLGGGQQIAQGLDLVRRVEDISFDG